MFMIDSAHERIDQEETKRKELCVCVSWLKKEGGSRRPNRPKVTPVADFFILSPPP